MGVKAGSSPTSDSDLGSGLAGAIGRGLRSALKEDFEASLPESAPEGISEDDWPFTFEWSAQTSWIRMADAIAKSVVDYLEDNEATVTDTDGNSRSVPYLK